MSAGTWTSTVSVVGDCLTCGEYLGEVAGREAKTSGMNRKARRHAEQNPGHHVVVERLTARSYRTTDEGITS